MPAPPPEVGPDLSGLRAVADAEVDTGTELVPVELVSGSVTIDRNSIWRRQFTGSLAPDTDRELLQPRGHRLRVRRGVVAPDGRTFWASLIYGRLTGYGDRMPGGEWPVGAKSLEYQVKRFGFLGPRVLEGTSAVSVARTLIAEAVADAYFDVDDGVRDAPLPRVVHDQDRWAAIDNADESIARALSAEVFCDGDGTFRMVAAPDMSGEPAYALAEGGALVDYRESASEDDVHNVVVATGSRVDGEGPLPYGVWWDDEPGSPTYVGDVLHAGLSGARTLDQVLAAGEFGARGFGASVRYYSSPLLLDDGQATRAARTIGQRDLGVQRQVAFTGVVNPWADLEVVDLGVDGRVERTLIDKLTIPVVDLDAPMPAETRSRSW